MMLLLNLHQARKKITVNLTHVRTVQYVSAVQTDSFVYVPTDMKDSTAEKKSMNVTPTRVKTVEHAVTCSMDTLARVPLLSVVMIVQSLYQQLNTTICTLADSAVNQSTQDGQLWNLMIKTGSSQ